MVQYVRFDLEEEEAVLHLSPLEIFQFNPAKPIQLFRFRLVIQVIDHRRRVSLWGNSF